MAIPSRATSFLDVRREGRRHPEVDHEADRGMIDTHAEGIGRAHHPVLPPREFVLEARSRGWIQARVVRHRTYAPAAKIVGQTTGGGARQDVDQRRRSFSLPEFICDR